MQKKVRVRGRLVERLVGYGSIGLLALTLLALVFPISGDGALAEGEPLTSSNSLKAATYVYSTLAVSLSDSVNLDVMPKANGSFASGEAELKVTTNNTTGYQVYLQTGDNTSSLKPANGMVQAEIGPVVGEMNNTNYQNHLNTWGYAITSDSATDNLSYRAIPSSSEPAIITTDKLSAEDSYTLGFATAVGADLPAGKYYNSVLVSVVANPIAVHTLSGITYMQEMSPYVCDYSDEDETKQLIDTRDGKSYWVAKLKDGNCWMTQNLALDLDVNAEGNAVAVSEEGKLAEISNSNTDIVSATWKPNYPETFKTNSATKNSNTTISRQYSWNFGKVVTSLPLITNNCNNGLSDKLFSVPLGGDISTACADFGNIMEVSGENWQPTYTAVPISADSNGKYVFNGIEMTSAQNLVAVHYNNSNDPSTGGVYDSHYLFGNYYQYSAAIANSTFDTARNSIATSSICPKNWTLPTTARDDDLRPIINPNQPTKSFYQLLLAYGGPTSKDYVINTSQWGTSVSATISLQSFFPYPRAGYIGNNYIRRAGGGMVFLSNAVDSGTQVMTLSSTNGNTFQVTDTLDQWQGYSVRCVAR